MNGRNHIVPQASGRAWVRFVNGEQASRRIKTVKPRVMNAKPKDALLIFCDGHISLAAAALPVHFVSSELLCLGIESVETVVGCNPHDAGVINEQPVNLIIAQAVWIVGFVRVGLNCPAVSSKRASPWP